MWKPLIDFIGQNVPAEHWRDWWNRNDHCQVDQATADWKDARKRCKDRYWGECTGTSRSVPVTGCLLKEDGSNKKQTQARIRQKRYLKKRRFKTLLCGVHLRGVETLSSSEFQNFIWTDRVTNDEVHVGCSKREALTLHVYGKDKRNG